MYDDYDLIIFLRTIEKPLQILQNDYKVRVSEKNGLILLKYHQFNTPKCHLTNQCRGVVLDATTFDIVCRGFYRFFNAGEPQAHAIDWQTAVITEKVDGSLIRFYYHDNKWCIATSGCIDACDSSLPTQVLNECTNFGDLVVSHLLEGDSSLTLLDKFNKNYTYLFELVSVYNRVVVPYDKTNMYYLCRMNNLTGTEDSECVLGFNTPQSHDFSNLNDCVEASQKLGYDEEGYVVRDKNFNRIKIKSPEYVLAHHVRGEGGLTIKKILALFESGEDVEFLSYFPEYLPNFEKVKKAIQAYVSLCVQALEYVTEYGIKREDISRIIEKPYSGFVFKRLAYNGVTALDCFWDLFTRTQIQIVEAHSETHFNSFRAI